MEPESFESEAAGLGRKPRHDVRESKILDGEGGGGERPVGRERVERRESAAVVRENRQVECQTVERDEVAASRLVADRDRAVLQEKLGGQEIDTDETWSRGARFRRDQLGGLRRFR